MERKRLRVDGIPTDVPVGRAKDKLTIHFLRSRNGGGEVENIDIIQGTPAYAIVTFEDDEVVDSVLRITDHTLQINDKIYNLVVSEDTGKMEVDETRSSVVERKMVFKGKVSNSIPRCGINVKHQIRYPVKGGTALILFEEPSVAARLIEKKHHKVAIEECHINVMAEPMELVVLDNITMDMSRSPQKILVSSLPANISEETLLDKLELFFGKTKNGGGELENREFLIDCRSAILTFTKEGVAPQLIEKKKFDVTFGSKETHQVCVSPSLDGDIARYEVKNLLCNRTVLITGIPDIKDEETLKDLLQIHFQKGTNGGGEVKEILYSPLGKNIIALFEDDEDGDPQE